MSRSMVILLSVFGLFFGIACLAMPHISPEGAFQPKAAYTLFGLGIISLLGSAAGLIPYGRDVTARLFGGSVFILLLVAEIMLFLNPDPDAGNLRFRAAGFLILIQAGCLYMAITGKFGIDFTGKGNLKPPRRPRRHPEDVNRRRRSRPRRPSSENSTRSVTRGNSPTRRRRPTQEDEF
ncbi:MAG: hypothetical protein KDA65_10755 [Planctomycetaceae bacterium]|nr:hypothetical protein [Planctomycetaceae bacterium]